MANLTIKINDTASSIIITERNYFERMRKKERLEIEKDTSLTLRGTCTFSAQAFFPADKQERWIHGEELLLRAQKCDGIHGMELAEKILMAQEKIPKEWRQLTLLFPGTIWRNKGGKWILTLVFNNQKNRWTEKIECISGCNRPTHSRFLRVL